MGFFDKMISAGSKVMESADRYNQKQVQNIERDIRTESSYARSKSDSELKAQISNKENSYASRYAAKSELENRSYGK